jgi:tRNA threonylcarbamoyladenosine biosynthesis protein TsaB
MKILAIETATGCLSAALLDGANVLAAVDREATGQHARLLIPTIDDVMRASGLALGDLEGLAVSIGPGSFTGLRVGLASMMALRMSTGLPLVAVPTLEALAWNFRTSLHPLCPVLKARAGEVYWACYQWSPAGTLKQLHQERVGSLEQLTETVDGSAMTFGEGWEANRNECLRLFKKRGLKPFEAPAGKGTASAVSVGLAGQDLFRRGDVAGRGLSPRYVQRAEAELAMALRTAGRG